MYLIRLSAWMLACLVLTSAHAGTNSWSARGPYGGAILDVAIDPSNTAIVYAASFYVLYKSTDGGVNWSELSNDFGRYPIVDIRFDPSNSSRIYVASMGGGIFRSTNAGGTFTRISALPTDANVDGPYKFAISADGNSLYYSTIAKQFFRSTDGGATFSRLADMPFTSRQLLVDPANGAVIFATVNATSGGTKLMKSVNGGSSWSELPQPVSNINGATIALVGAPTTLWLSAVSSVWTTQNDGVNWTLSKTFSEGQVLYPDASSAGALYAGPSNNVAAVWKYAGGVWQQLASAVPGRVNALSASPNNSSIVIAATFSGVYRTINDGVNWNRSDDGINAETISTLAVGPGGIYAGTDHGEISMTADDSQFQRREVVSYLTSIWDKVQIASIAPHPVDPNSLIVGFNAGGYRYTANGGATWNVGSSLSTAWFKSITYDPTNPSLVYATVQPSVVGPIVPVQASTDGGMTFSARSTNVSMSLDLGRIIVDPRNPARLFFVSNDILGNSSLSGVFRSVDSGSTWTNLKPGMAPIDIMLDPNESKRIYAVTQGGLQISDDGGDTFTVTSALPYATYGNPFAIAVDPVISNIVYVITARYVGSNGEYFVMRSVDGGISWERIPNSTLPVWVPVKLAIHRARPTVLFVGTGGRGMQSIELAPDLAVNITGHSGTRSMGSQSFFDVQAQNAGPFAATGLAFTIAVPTNATNLSVTIPGGACTVNSGTAQCSLPFLKTGAVASVRVNYTASVLGALSVQANLTARERDPAATNNIDVQSVTVIQPPDPPSTGGGGGSSSSSGGGGGGSLVAPFIIALALITATSRRRRLARRQG